MKQGQCQRPIVLPTDHLRGPQPLRTDYSEFERPTVSRRWAEQARKSRAKR